MKLFNVLLSIVVSAVMALVVFEIGLRVLGFGPPKTILEFDAHTGWRKSANAELHRKGPEFDVTLRTNELGLADDPMPSAAKPAGAFRVLVLGDSFTQGFTVERSDLFVDLLEHRWKAEGRAIDVVNAGTEGWSTDQEVAWFLANGAAFEPDLVLVAAYENDLYWNGQREYWDRFGPKPLFRNDGSLEIATCVDPGPKPWCKRLATTLLFSRPNAEHFFRPEGSSAPIAKEFACVLNEPPEFLRRSVEGTRGALVALKAECARLGARTALLAIPSHASVEPNYGPVFAKSRLGGLGAASWSADNPVETLLALAAELAIPTLDPREALRSAQRASPQYFDVDWHLNPVGNRTLAAFLHDQLDATGAIPATHAAKTAVAADAALPPTRERSIDWKFAGALFAGLWIALTATFVSTYADEPKALAPLKIGAMLLLVFAIFLGGREALALIPRAWAGGVFALFVAGVLGFVAWKLGRRMATIAELLRAFVLRGHWYLMPLLVVLLTIGSLLVVAASSPLIAPFIYTLF
jgi:hypothetical protein